MSFFGAFEFLEKGGWVAWTLAFLSAGLWYAIGYRFLFLRSQYLKSSPDRLIDRKNLDQEDLLGEVATKVKAHAEESANDLETALEFEFQSFSQGIQVHKQTIKSIVIVAPLLGLLGTVIGMIETFESLQDAALFSQSGGIAGGISQALITTQMGLVVAIPGLLIGRRLDKKEEELSSFVERLIGSFNLKGVKS